MADMVSSSFVGTTEWDDLCNRHLTEVYDLLVASGPSDYYASDYALTTQSGVIPYALPSDFRSLVNVYVTDGGRYLPLLPMRDMQRAGYEAPSGAYSVTLEYVPAPPTFTADGDTFDGVSGWEELISAMMARDALVKEESDPSAVMAIIDRLTARIRSASSYRSRGPKMCTNVLDASTDYPAWSNGAPLHSYRLRGGNIELFRSSQRWP
ncbi:MAG TPA: hypothetical protein PLT98_06945 [Thauera aminoaromatica]|nr:hypothetical protein [Thauera aminoaromatica]